ncbi:MAG: hypothetical protein WC810_25270 [Janthinobacterium sp.]
MTATQTLEQMKQAIKAIGPLVFSWMLVIQEMSELRIYNIIENNTDPIDVTYADGEIQKIYKSFTLSDVKLDTNVTGSSVIQFTNQDPGPEVLQAIRDYERQQAKQGNHIRYNLVNIEKLRQWRLHWYITVASQERESTALQKIMLTDELNQAATIMNLTGRRLSGDTVVNEFERLYKKKNFFEKAPDAATLAASKAKMMQDAGMDPNAAGGSSGMPPEMAMAAGSAGGNSPMGGQIEAAVSKAAKRPSINSAVA